jgi:hypothetical protein
LSSFLEKKLVITAVENIAIPRSIPKKELRLEQEK